MKQEEFLTELAMKCVERMQALDLKGKKRDDAAMHYMVGAAMALTLSESEYLIQPWIVGPLAHWGYVQVEQQAAQVHVPEAALQVPGEM